MNLLVFLAKVFVISFSGAASPGPISATAIVAGAHNRWAGALIAVGYGIIELPLIVLIVLGSDFIFSSAPVQIGIGGIGGVLLGIMALTMFLNAAKPDSQNIRSIDTRPILAGIVLSVSNPYFLLWWATVGLTLAGGARELGLWAFPLFALVHWLCDCLWVTALSWAGFKGSALLGQKCQSVILYFCSVALFIFAMKFIHDSVAGIVRLMVL